MKKLSCADVDESMGCNFAAEGNTNEEVIGKLFAHAGEAHKDKLQGMSDEDKKAVTDKMNELLNKQ